MGRVVGGGCGLWRPAHAHQIHPLGQDQSTVAQWAEITKYENINNDKWTASLTGDTDTLDTFCALDTCKLMRPFSTGWDGSSPTGTCCDRPCPGPDDCEWPLACRWERCSVSEVCRLPLTCGWGKRPANGEGTMPLWWRWDNSPAAATGKGLLLGCSWPEPTAGDGRALLTWGWGSCAEDLVLLLKLVKETCPANGEWMLLLFCSWKRERERETRNNRIDYSNMLKIQLLNKSPELIAVWYTNFIL